MKKLKVVALLVVMMCGLVGCKEDVEVHTEYAKAQRNNPINYFGILFWGCEIPIICQGEDRPILSEGYIKNVLLPIVNKQK